MPIDEPVTSSDRIAETAGPRGRDAVRDYVALDRALTRLETLSPARSAELRLHLTRARATYLRRGDAGHPAYVEALALLGSATASALLEVEPGDATSTVASAAATPTR